MSQHAVDDLESDGCKFYLRAMELLTQDGIKFLVGGAYALERHAGIVRRTKDFDIFLMPEDIQHALHVLSEGGYQTELVFSHWLAKAHQGDDLLDLIFSSGNGICRVDREWFEHSVPGVVLGTQQHLCPPEETIWQKAFIMERDRCDSADVAHLLRARGAELDWKRLLRRFGEHWRVLYAHLILFGFIYPDEATQIPVDVMETLAARLACETPLIPGDKQICRGTLLSATQYLIEITVEGYTDGRVKPLGRMSQKQVAQWTDNFASQIAKLGVPTEQC